MTFMEKARLAERAARASGAMLEAHGAFEIRRKSENDFVTEMDLKSEQLIRDILLTACPEDEFFGEEYGGATQAVGRWIVDPIDGTANFMRGQRLYTISIAYEHDGELAAGCVYCPGTDELFLAARQAHPRLRRLDPPRRRRPPGARPPGPRHTGPDRACVLPAGPRH